MREIEKRLIRLEERAERLRQIRQAHEPFLSVMIMSVMSDSAEVWHYDEGTYKTPVKRRNLSIEESLTIARGAVRKGIYAQCDLCLCREWIHTVFIYGDRAMKQYSRDQRREFVENDYRNFSEIRMMYKSPDYLEIMNTLLGLPGVFPI